MGYILTQVKKKNIILFLLVFSIIIFLPRITYGQPNYISSAVPILLYHHIAEENPTNNEYIISPDNFYEHINFLKENGYVSITLNEYYNYRAGKCSLPEKPIIITFDDGYYSNYQYAYPILKSMDMKATIFIATKFADDDSSAEISHFSWAEAREMQESNTIDIQSHSHSHSSFLALDRDSVIQELSLSKELIEKNLNKECNYFAYPNGIYNSEIQKLTTDAGYLMQFTTNYGYNTDLQPTNELKRITVTYDMTSKYLADILLPYQIDITNINVKKNENISLNVDFHITNNIRLQNNSKVVLAIYDENNTLLHFEYKDIFLDNSGYTGGFYNFILPEYSQTRNYTSKLICIDNLTNLYPYTPSVTIIL